jgi:hypothetical protein
MPIDFVENVKAQAPVEFFRQDTKARPQNLEGEVLPELIHRVSAWTHNSLKPSQSPGDPPATSAQGHRHHGHA